MSNNQKKSNNQSRYNSTQQLNIEEQPTKTLEVGDKIELFGGYDDDPLYLKHPRSSKRTGQVTKFIIGQDESPAAVIKLDTKISGDSITGDIVVLELRHVGQNWFTTGPVHIELCDFEPENKTWKDRRQGEWVEAAAWFRIIK